MTHDQRLRAEDLLAELRVLPEYEDGTLQNHEEALELIVEQFKVSESQGYSEGRRET